MLSRFAPLQVLFAAVLAVIVAVAGAVWAASQQRWLGLDLEPAGAAGVRVAAVAEDGPASGLLSPGDVISAAGRPGNPVSLAHYNPDVAPHIYPTFAEYEAYLAFQDRLADATRTGTLMLRLADDRTVTLSPRARHPWYALGLDFWLFNLFGCMAALIGLSVWVFRPGLDSARLLAISGIGFFAATWNNSVYTVRDLAMVGHWFDLVLRANNLGLHLMLGALMALLASYPRRLGHGRRAIWASFGMVAVVQLNENLHLFDWPQHSFYIPILAYYVLGAGLALAQWRRSSNDPLDRGALRWVVLSVLTSTGAGLVAYFMPLLFTGEALVSTAVMVGLAVTLYVGFALGVLRYRLFDLERWWFGAWVWFFGGLSVVAVDAALVLLLGFEPVYALGLAVIFAGWGYFPARQWLWRRLSGGGGSNNARELADLVQRVLAAGNDDAVERSWQEALASRLEPLAVDPAPEGRPIEVVALSENGARLDVPGIAGGAGVMLRFGKQGRRLFSREDVALVRTMHELATRIHGVRRAKEEAASTERRRIMRDLHDDVGGQLLSLILTAEDEEREALARRALQSLREAINALDDDQNRLLADFLDDWRDGASQRLGPAGTELIVAGDWDAVAHHNLSPRQAINLRRVLDESLTNALKHASPRWLRVWLGQQDGRLQLALEHDGLLGSAVNEPDAPGGRGLSNMRTRVDELGGEIETGFHNEADGAVYRVALSLPLN
ncbi:hypothetical protein H0Z60_01790 [Ectothiorhodospiraceae bacterium WFHF3C12]|nr:hypothetical protein [Ectothiorhodospiraceae bacterium WFHF3C12]